MGDLARATHTELGARALVLSAHVASNGSVAVVLTNAGDAAVDVTSGELRVIVTHVAV
jgi:hypothetical protein